MTSLFPGKPIICKNCQTEIHGFAKITDAWMEGNLLFFEATYTCDKCSQKTTEKINKGTIISESEKKWAKEKLAEFSKKK